MSARAGGEMSMCQLARGRETISRGGEKQSRAGRTSNVGSRGGEDVCRRLKQRARRFGYCDMLSAFSRSEPVADGMANGEGPRRHAPCGGDGTARGRLCRLARGRDVNASARAGSRGGEARAGSRGCGRDSSRVGLRKRARGFGDCLTPLSFLKLRNCGLPRCRTRPHDGYV